MRATDWESMTPVKTTWLPQSIECVYFRRHEFICSPFCVNTRQKNDRNVNSDAFQIQGGAYGRFYVYTILGVSMIIYIYDIMQCVWCIYWLDSHFTYIHVETHSVYCTPVPTPGNTPVTLLASSTVGLRTWYLDPGPFILDVLEYQVLQSPVLQCNVWTMYSYTRYSRTESLSGHGIIAFVLEIKNDRT